MILNYLFFDYDLKRAVDEPRVHNEWKPNVTYVEDNFDKVGFLQKSQRHHKQIDKKYCHNYGHLLYVLCLWMQSVLKGLRQKNHDVNQIRILEAEVHVAVREEDRICAECDRREGGYPAGYWITPVHMLLQSRMAAHSLLFKMKVVREKSKDYFDSIFFIVICNRKTYPHD